MQGPRSKLLVKTSDKDAIACKRANKQLERHKWRAKNKITINQKEIFFSIIRVTSGTYTKHT